MIGALSENKRTKFLVWFGVEMTTSKKLISSWKTKPYIKLSTLKKQFFWTWLIKAIGISRIFTHTNLLWRKNSNTFPMISIKTTNLGKLYLLPKIHKPTESSNRESIRASWFSFKASNAKRLVIHLRLWRFYW